jgi:hypothetical protein
MQVHVDWRCDVREVIAPDMRVPVRQGPRPLTTRAEVQHDQLDQPSPPEIRDRLLAHARALPDVVVGPSMVSEPASIGLRLPGSPAGREAFLAFDEFAHVHRSGFLHLTLPLWLISTLHQAGRVEPHPIVSRSQFPETIVMLYAPRDEEELALTAAVLNTSYAMARG